MQEGSNVMSKERELLSDIPLPFPHLEDEDIILDNLYSTF